MKGTTFQKLEVVKAAIGLVHSRISSASIRTDWPSFSTAGCDALDCSPLIRAQSIASAIAKHYGLAHVTFVVELSESLPSAARVEVRRTNEIFIECRRNRATNRHDICTVLSHEIAHIFLDRLGLRFSDNERNEILTDTVAIYLGFGVSYLCSQRVEVHTGDDGTKWQTTNTLGYISPEEIGYIVAQRDQMRSEDSLRHVDSARGRIGYIMGRKRLNCERRCRPYISRNLLDRTLWRFGWVPKSEVHGITFPCWVCKQPLRVPALRKAIIARCPRCGERAKCYS